ncbi:MAG: glutamine-hydrolyzing carbamoyl-phosphate synthase small subunit [Desulfatibacillaceae bacterium]
MKALLALEDGRTFPCRSFTGSGEARGEVVFNTGMTGYQEVLTDPSYRGQMVTMTYSLIGNYGINHEDVESAGIQVSAFIVREYQPNYSNFRATASLADYLSSQGVLGVDELDTRALTRHLRTRGAMRAIISTTDTDPESLVRRTQVEVPNMQGLDLASGVSTDLPYLWQDGRPTAPGANTWRKRGEKLSVVAFDYGIKYNILRCLDQTGCEVLVVPAGTSADDIRAMEPDGVFLSNGPGDPEPVQYAVDAISDLVGEKPMFGICLGHQLMGLALGGRTYKLKFGHRGANQPVKNLRTGRVEITSQNHGFCVDLESMGDDIEITHVNLNDNTLEGFRHKALPVSAVQYHPEASPGPHDARYLFRDFLDAMNKARGVNTPHRTD